MRAYLEQNLVLVQDVSEFLAIINPFMDLALPHYNLRVNSREHLLQWIICQEIESTRLINVKDHYKNGLYEEIYAKLLSYLCTVKPILLTSYFNVPVVYGDDLISVKLKGRSLYITTHVSTFPARLICI